MGYALFANRKVQVTGQINSVSLLQTQSSNEQYLLATNTLSLNQQLTSITAAQSGELAQLYKLLSSTTDSGQRESINAQIQAKQKDFEVQNANINNQIYLVEIKEQAIEMEVKRLDTQISALQKQLEAVEQAESGGIDRATPKFKGVA